MRKLRLLLGDDHPLVRHGLRKVLEERPEWEVVSEVGEGREAVREAIAHKPDVAILDVAMPLLNGIDAAQQIVRRAPETRILMLSMHADEAYVMRAVQAGATGYMVKDAAGKELLTAIESVAAGRPYFSPAIERLVQDDRRTPSSGFADRYDTLSAREREVFQLIAEAKSNKEVAVLLGISPATVETHRARILQKLDVHSIAEVVRYAARLGIIS
ncbi:MAG TPA: response regulator transcription factor [Vicinamibacterales bacterium]|nr:response regulator transcription factor [Vicinamibacterales bacterium]